MGVLRHGYDAYSPIPVDVAKSAGMTFGWHYLLGSKDKDLNDQVRRDNHAAGIDIILNAENTATDADGGYPAGVNYGTLANQQADALGAPHGPVVIIYSVDEQRSASQIVPYFNGIASVRNGRRRGGYGGVEFVGLLDSGLIDIWGQANAGSWSGYPTAGFPTHPRAHFRQYLATSISGHGYDPQEQMAVDCGFWLSPTSTNPTPPAPPVPFQRKAIPYALGRAACQR